MGAEQAGLERVSFQVCDVSDASAVRKTLGAVIAESDGPVAFYLRFFLHAINEKVQGVLMEAIKRSSRPGDLFTAEFRTDKDEANTKAHGNHYRRFQNAEKFHRDAVGLRGARGHRALAVPWGGPGALSGHRAPDFELILE